MQWTAQNHHQSALGQLLIDKRLITQERLELAPEHQQKTRQRLGEVLAEWKPMTQRQIRGVMRRQRGLRLVTAILAALMAPLQMYAAEVPVLRVSEAIQTIPAIQRQSGMQNMSERDLSRAAVQTLPANKSGNFVNLNQLVTNRLLDPMLMFLEFKTTVKEIAQPTEAIYRYDGPTSVYNICVRGSTGQCFATVSVIGVDQRGTTYNVTLH